MSRKFKKLTLQYAYLKLEKEDIEEICQDVEKEMRDYLKKNYPQHCEAFFNPPEKPKEGDPLSLPESEEEKATEEEESAPPKNKDLKKLYRKIAEKTHPDKVGNNNYADLFSEAAKAYAENNIAKLLNMAGSLNIELSELSRESVLLLENNVKTLSEEIDIRKKSTGWIWHNSTSDEEREVIIINILKFKGLIPS